MSRSVRGSKGCGYDYWGKRAMSQCSPGRENKKLTLGIERMRARAMTAKETAVAMDYDSHNDYWLDTWHMEA